MPKLTGERIVLREYRAEDLGEIRKWVNDPATTRYLSTRFGRRSPWTTAARFWSA